MNTPSRSSIETRETILKLLSDDENARTSTAETANRLVEGDEYLDLGKLDEGVCRADGKSVVMGRVLPRKALRDATWKAIMKQLATH